MFVELDAVFDVEMADERRVGRSRMSDNRSMLRESSKAFRRRSRRAFSDRVL